MKNMKTRIVFAVFCFGLITQTTLLSQVSRAAATHYNDAVLAIKQNDTQAAIGHFNKAIEVEPAYQKAFYNRGKSYLKLKEYSSAITDFKKVVGLDPDHALAYYYMGYANLQTKQYPAAIFAYNKALAKDPELTDVYKNRGVAFMKEAKYQKAADDFTHAYQHKPEDLSVIYNRAICHAKLDAHDASSDDYQLLVNEGYKTDITAKELGKSLVKRENYAHGLKALQLAAKHVPEDDYEVHYLMGYSYLKMDKIEDAHNHFKQAISRKSDHIPTLKNLAFTSFKIKDYATAAQTYDQLIASTPGDATLHLNRGLSYLQLEEYGQAISDFSTVIKHEPQMATAFYNRATAAIAIKQHDAACKDMRQAARLGYEDAFNHIASVCQDN